MRIGDEHQCSLLPDNWSKIDGDLAHLVTLLVALLVTTAAVLFLIFSFPFPNSLQKESNQRERERSSASERNAAKRVTLSRRERV